MTAELSPSEINGRFKFIEPPFPLPGKCAVCGNARRPVVDFGATVDYYGAVLICEACIIQAFSLLAKIGRVEVPQSVPPEEYQRIADDLKEAFDGSVGNIRNLLDAYSGFSTSVSHALARAGDETSEGTSGESSEATDGPAEQTSDDARDEGPAGVPSGGFDKRSGISGL